MGVPVAAPRLPAIQHYFNEDMLYLFDPGDLPSSACRDRHRIESQADRQRRVENARTFLANNNWNTHQAALLNVYASA